MPSSDPVHGVENILPLHVHRKPARLADGAKMLREHIERHFALGKIDEHDHCEVALHERLADVENVDVLLGERGGDVRGDAFGVARKYGYDGFHGRSPSLSMNKSIIHGFCNFSMSALHGNCTCIFPPRMI